MLKLELRYSGALSSATALSYTAYGFYDVGVVRQREAAGSNSSASAASAGLGMRFSAGRHWSGVVEFAQPLTKIVDQENDNNPRVFAGVSLRF